jgi:nucleoside-diphosphate-sugar epimerase
VLELAQLIWRKVRGPDVAFRWVSDPGFEHDVQRRVPATDKAARVLGFEAKTGLEDMLDEVVPWVEAAIRDGRI